MFRDQRGIVARWSLRALWRRRRQSSIEVSPHVDPLLRGVEKACRGYTNTQPSMEAKNRSSKIKSQSL